MSSLFQSKPVPIEFDELITNLKLIRLSQYNTNLKLIRLSQYKGHRISLAKARRSQYRTAN